MKAREAAFRVVHEVLYKKGYSNIALEQILEKEKFDGIDAGFITEIVLGTLRNGIMLEYIISCYSNIKINKISPSVKSAMLTGLYQILFMNRTPDSAACNETVKIAAKFSGQRTRGFVNAILRSVSREKNSINGLLDKLEGTRHISVKYSCSHEAVEKLVEQYGREKTIGILSAVNMPAHLCVRFNDSNKKNEHEKIFNVSEIDFEKGSIAFAAYYPKLKKPISSLELYKNGVLSIQDEGAQVMSEFIDLKQSETVLDACASPGGKAVHISCIMNGSGEITACDIYPHRVENMKKSISRTKRENIRCIEKDMSVVHDEFIDKFDTVLIDAPCSGLGSAQRRPEIKLKYKEDNRLYELQNKILDACLSYVKPGGKLVYGTCTLLREENRDIVERMLSAHGEFTLVKEKTIIPDGRTGGFYMAAMVKKL